MTDLLFRMGLSNACFALALAIVAMLAGAKAKRPHLTHMLWLLVFVKLMTPPILTIPVGLFTGQPNFVVVTDDHGFTTDEHPVPAEQVQAFSSSLRSGALLHRAKPWLVSIWLLGGGVVLAWSLRRVYRFGRLLASESETAPPELQTVAVKLSRRLGVKTLPVICTTSARLSPMVWWTGRKVRVIIPAALLDELDTQQSQWILAHELAHVRRRDHLVRWLEWLACVCFWWNPVVWWAQRNLRVTEEVCCDDLVISCLNPKPKFYADSLLSAVEFLARPVFRTPAVASEINSGGFLERRFKMIVSEKSNRSNSRRWQFFVLMAAVVVLPLGFASAQDYEAVERRLGKAVSKGELSLEQARLMMETLRNAGGVQEGRGADRAKAYLMKVRKELGAAVKAGRISEEDAIKRYEAAKKGIREKMAAGDRRRGARRITIEEYKRAEAEMRKMIEDGKAKPEDVERRLIDMRKAMSKQSDREKKGISIEDYRRAEAKLTKMVEEGKAKPEDVERRLIEMRKAMSKQADREKKGITIEDYRRAEAKMKKMVEEGKAKPEDVERRLNEMRRMMDDEIRDDATGGRR